MVKRATKKENSNVFVNRKTFNLKFKPLAVTVLAFSIVACGGSDDTPAPTKDTTAPILKITEVKIVALDSDGKLNDIEGKFTANEALQNETVAVDSVVGTVNGKTFFVNNIPAGAQTVKVTAKDAAGNQGVATKAVALPTPTFTAQTTVTPNAINEQESGKIATLSTVVTKTLSGNDTVVTNANSQHTLKGEDASLLKIENGAVFVKEGQGLDSEDKDGNGIAKNQTYDYTVHTSVIGLENNSTATDTDIVSSENIDTDDFAPFPGLIVELNGETRAEYLNTVAKANELSTISASAHGHDILNAIVDAAGADFTRNVYEINGSEWSYLAYKGKRLSKASTSRILMAVEEGQDPSQYGALTNFFNTSDIEKYVAKALMSLTDADFSEYKGQKKAAEIEISAELAAKIGAAAIVNMNIDLGLIK